MTAPTIAGVDVGAAAKKIVGFLEEAPGVKSSTRLVVMICVALAASVTGVMDWYVIHQTLAKLPVDANVLTALIGAIAAFILNGAVAIIRRTKAEGGDA